MRMLIGALVCASPLVWACSRAEQPDAYGNVEASMVTVSAETAGQLLAFDIVEGQSIEQGQVVATVDAAQSTLERDQLVAQQDAVAARLGEIDRQADVLVAQRASLEAQRAAAVAQRAGVQVTRDVAQRTYDRTSILFSQQAATIQQRDQAERELKTADEQLRAQAEQITAIDRQLDAQAAQVAATRAQKTTVQRQVEAAGAQVARISERIAKTEVRNPLAGTVLVTYVHSGELVQPGKPLYRVANLSRVDVRAYISEGQLASTRLGQTASVTYDRSGTRESVAGTVSWIASQAEFTPTPIQTRDERTDLVYAIKLSVPNDGGALKIGMPVDVSFQVTP